MKKKEMTLYAFTEHIKSFLKKLLTDPLKADTDEFLKGYGLDAPKTIKLLLKKTDPNDEESSIMIKKTSIKDNGRDENGKRLRDSFIVKYRVPRKKFNRKIRNLYIPLFESNIIDDCPIIEEGAWGYGILDNDSALDYQSDTTKDYLLKVINDINKSSDADSKWAKVGVLVDFLKKYKSDELQVTKEYGIAVDFAKKVLRDLLNDGSFTSSWDDETKIKSSIKKAFNDVSSLRYNENIMIPDKDDSYIEKGEIVKSGPKPNDGKLMEDGECGATNAGSSGEYTASFLSKPLKRTTMYITQEQAAQIGNLIKENDGEGAMSTPPVDSRIGSFGYPAPIGDGKNNKGNDFYKEANDHKNIMAKSWPGAKK